MQKCSWFILYLSSDVTSLGRSSIWCHDVERFTCFVVKPLSWVIKKLKLIFQKIYTVFRFEIQLRAKVIPVCKSITT